MKKLVLVLCLIINGCLLSSDSKGGGKGNSSESSKENGSKDSNSGRFAICGYWGGFSKEVNQHCRNDNKSSNKSDSSKGHGADNNKK